jgi:hypothetical protein
MKKPNAIPALGQYQNQWVALSHDKKRVVAADRAFGKALNKAAKKGEKHPVMFKVLPATSFYVV